MQKKFTWEELAERRNETVDVALTDDMEMHINLHPFINRTPYTVIESMLVAKALVTFRQVGLRHTLVVPQYQARGVSKPISLRSLFTCDLYYFADLSGGGDLNRARSQSS